MKRLFETLHFRIIRWFEINWGWIFINPNKTDKWYKYLNRKYNTSGANHDNEI